MWGNTVTLLASTSEIDTLPPKHYSCYNLSHAPLVDHFSNGIDAAAA
jgi:hypothetical protein